MCTERSVCGAEIRGRDAYGQFTTIRPVVVLQPTAPPSSRQDVISRSVAEAHGPTAMNATLKTSVLFAMGFKTLAEAINVPGTDRLAFSVPLAAEPESCTVRATTTFGSYVALIAIERTPLPDAILTGTLTVIPLSTRELSWNHTLRVVAGVAVAV